MRHRLAETLSDWLDQGISPRFALSRQIEKELGIDVPSNFSGYQPQEVLRRADLRDVLDAITLTYRVLAASPAPERAKVWQRTVARVFAEENVGYTVDASCGVHYSVDEQFERSRAATVALLGHPDLRAALTAYDDAHRHMDAQPQDTKAAVRSMFEAVEIAARRLCPESRSLNKWLAENTLKERCLALLPGEQTEQRVWATVFDSLAEWVDGLHNYRHGQGVAEPVAPSPALAVEALSSGATYLRVLGGCVIRREQAGK